MEKNMSSKIVSDILYQELNNYLQKKNSKPLSLIAFSVGKNISTEIYFSELKKKLSAELNYNIEIRHYNDILVNYLAKKIKEANKSSKYDGILIQVPIFDDTTESRKIYDTISLEKDVDCLNSASLGKLLVGEPFLVPCTPLGIITLLKAYSVSLEGKKAVIINRSNLLGKPLEQLLLRENATVTLAHSKTQDLISLTKEADILIAALNKAKYIDSYYIKEDAIIIDVGFNQENSAKIVGNISYNSIYDKCQLIAPATAGIGPMTVCLLGYSIAKARYGEEVEQVLTAGVEKAKQLVK